MFGRKSNRHCPSDGELRALFDGGHEVSRATRIHVAQCLACGVRTAELRDSAEASSRLLAQLDDGLPKETPITFAALRSAADQRGVALSQGGSLMTAFWDRRAMRAATAMVALVAVVGLLVLTPMGSAASSVFNRFRVERFAAITIDPDEFGEFQTEMALRFVDSDRDALMSVADGLFSYESSFNLEDPTANGTELGSAAEAEAAFGPFEAPEALPDGFETAPTYYVTEAGSVDITFDTAKLQTVLDELDLQLGGLPNAAEHPAIDISMEAPPALMMEYTGATEGQHIIVMQLTSPTLNVPEYLDMDLLREDVLRLPGLPSDFVSQMRDISDWESTLLIPVPEGYSSDDVTVDGEPGLLLTADEGEKSAVIFEKSGMLYIVAGTASNDVIRDVAESLS